jgi:membrane-associated phospholipid phosphatase
MAMHAQAGGSDTLRYRVYRTNLHIDLPLTAVATATNFWGLSIVDSKPPLDSMTIYSLDAKDVNRFDRSATSQDADYAHRAQKVSDYGMAGSYLLPFLLLFDSEIRRDWAQLALLYVETLAITSNLFSWGAAIHIDRIRPLVYHPDVSYKDKTFFRNKNSFYSGHTSQSASASFFTAKVYCDYHPELGNRKYLVYSLALVPPAFTGIFRYKGMKHFPTDILTGLAVGSTVGLLVPHLHKITGANLSIVPYSGRFHGLALSYKF